MQHRLITTEVRAGGGCGPRRPSLDFVSDSFTDGRRFRILAVVDDYTRECLALVADTSLSGARVAREKLERWRRDYNEVKPHGAIGNKVPISLMKAVGAASLPMAEEAPNSNAE